MEKYYTWEVYTVKFLKRINTLISECDKDRCKIVDQAFLYETYDQTPPLAKHVIFAPMPPEVMQSMIDSYKLSFPKELLTIYKVMNGADFFWTVHIIGEKKMRIPVNFLSIYGIPLTYDRKHIEPFNISIEDLDRPKGTPTNWLKFGSFHMPEESHRTEGHIKGSDLFVDVDNGEVFATEKRATESCIMANWSSIDECLCSIFERLERLYN